MIDPKDFLIEKLNQNPLDSKKFISGIVGVISVLFVWLGTAIGMLIKPDLATNFVNLATLTTPFLAGIVGGMLTGQVLFEKNAMASIQKADDNDKDEKIATMSSNGNTK